jgi:hypothetical protein
MFGGPEVNCHQSYSARDWLSILRTSYPIQNLQRKHRTEGEQLEDRRNVGGRSCNSGDGTDYRVQFLMFMMMMVIILTVIRLQRVSRIELLQDDSHNCTPLYSVIKSPVSGACYRIGY